MKREREDDHLVSVGHVTSRDAAYVVHIKPRPGGLLQSHGVAEDDWQRVALPPSFNVVGAELYRMHNGQGYQLTQESFTFTVPQV